MERVCANCGKGAQTGRTVAGHSKKSAPRKFRVNFQKYRGKWFCASCLKRIRHSQAPGSVTVSPSATETQ